MPHHGPLTSLCEAHGVSAFTTNQASEPKASYGMVGVLADFPIEWLTRGKRLTSCQRYMDKSHIVGVPSLVVFEVCRKVTTRVSEDESLRVAAWLRTFGNLNLSDEVALHAVDLSIAYKLGMADSLVLAHAIRENAQLVTLDNDFSTIKDVVVIRA